MAKERTSGYGNAPDGAAARLLQQPRALDQLPAKYVHGFVTVLLLLYFKTSQKIVFYLFFLWLFLGERGELV